MSLDYFLTAGIFVHLAMVFYALGFLFRDELILRMLILIGTMFYLLYYYYAADTPLWDALYASGILFIINASMIFIIITERTTFSLNEDEAALFASLRTLSPGQFRKVMKIAQWHEPQGEVNIVREGERSNKLFYAMPGKVTLNKDGQRFTSDGNIFVGEIGFMLDTPAGATVTLHTGTKYIEWDCQQLKKLLRKSQSLENALKAMFNYDLAKKVSNSFGRQV